MIDLAKLKQAALAATPEAPEWHQETEHDCLWNIVDSNGVQVAITQQRTAVFKNPKQTDRTAIAAFIAAADPKTVLALVRQVEELQEVARAALEYIDALPSDVADALPVMPGFDRDWAESAIAGHIEDDE